MRVPASKECYVGPLLVRLLLFENQKPIHTIWMLHTVTDISLHVCSATAQFFDELGADCAHVGGGISRFQVCNCSASHHPLDEEGH